MDLRRQKIKILGVSVDDISEDEAVRRIFQMGGDSKGQHYVVTVNTEFVMLAQKDREFFSILEGADLALADGKGIAISKLILGGKVQERITGVDLVEIICQKSANRPIRIGFLGGFGNVAAEARKRQIAKHGGLNIVFAEPGDPAIGYDLRLKTVLGAVGRIDILFVAYGMGQQEFWIKRNLKRLNVGVCIGVGGALDYIAGARFRAPKLIQGWGLEWLWRLFWEPKRAWRMRVLPIYWILLIKTILPGTKR